MVSARAIDRRQWEQSGIIQLVGGEIDDWHDMIERSADGWTLERVDDLTGWAPYTALYRMSLGDDSDESDHYYAVEEPNPLTCPKCGSDDDVRYTERVERAATATYRGGMIILDGSSLKVLDEVSERDGLYCEACDHDFAFPDGFVIEWT